MFCGNAFEDWPCVYVSAREKTGAEFGAHPSDEVFEAGLEDIMVIATPGVARNPGARRIIGAW